MVVPFVIFFESAGGFELVTRNAEFPAGARRDELQLRDQGLRDGPAVGAGLELVARDVELLVATERDQLQVRDQRLREGPAEGPGLELVARDAEFPAGFGRDPRSAPAINANGGSRP